jgi:two-component system, chemotaxis family, CheB/CheR fusion protein
MTADGIGDATSSGGPVMDFSEFRQVSALHQRLRRILSVFRMVAAHVGARGRSSDESASHLAGRIGAIGRAMLAPVFFDGVDLESLVLDELRLHAARPEQFSISGSEVRLDPDAADLMSLVIHELATNAVKYGALSQSRAKISVAWTVAHRFGHRILQFEWLEAGVRIIAGAPPTPGFGSELIERLIARELKGEGKMTFLSDGVSCAIVIPLADARRRHE